MADAVIVSPPRLVGTDTVAMCLGVASAHVRFRLAIGDERVTTGYLGKISGRHVWNAHELFASMYSTADALWAEIRRVEAGIRTSAPCTACERPAQFLGLCRTHIRELTSTFKRAQDSSVVVWQLLAMCRWVVDRNAHLSPPHGWDPWSGVCMTPSCQNRNDDIVGRYSPLCLSCSRTLWSHYH